MLPETRVIDGVVSSNDTHLRALEAEAIHIMREVVAEFERPVMLYSIGKDSSVLLRSLRKRSIRAPFRSRCFTSTPPTSSAR
jgi:3'-phosphoadenosine 5'-phosphosulfate sulfotransferase (PAPS reductase)/FAD synthetase